MNITYKRLFEIEEMKDAKVVAGIGGLNKIIVWCDIIEMPEPWNWINSGEIVFLSGIGLKDIDKDLERVLIELDKKEAVGLIVQVGPYITNISTKIKNMANQLDIPVIEIPYGIKVINIMYNVCKMLFVKEQNEPTMDGILKELMYLDYTDSMEEKAKYFGYSSKRNYISFAVEPDIIQFDKIDEGLTVLTVLNKIIHYMKFYFEQNGDKLFYTYEENTITLMVSIPNSKEYREYLNKNLKQVMNQFNLWRDITISVGIGSIFQYIQDFKRSSIEAKEALKMLRACKKCNDIRIYEEMGIYRILFQVKDNNELRRIHDVILGPLIEHDIMSNNDLVNTLEVYLMQDCNITKTSEALYLHRNTIKYRIQHIQEILNFDFKDVNICFNLRLAYKIRRFMMQ